ncbi:hypothetical protein FHY26_003895 [Xanthomonas campestris]
MATNEDHVSFARGCLYGKPLDTRAMLESSTMNDWRPFECSLSVRCQGYALAITGLSYCRWRHRCDPA